MIAVPFMRVVLVLLSVLLALGTFASTHASDINADESVVLFPTMAWQVDGGRIWEMEIHGWIYEKERRTVALSLIRKALGLRDRSQPEENAIFENRARLFVADNERGKRVVIRLGTRSYTLEKSTANGHFRGRLRLDAAEVDQIRQTPMGREDFLRFHVTAAPKRGGVFEGRVHLFEDKGLSIISDVDDTIKVTEVTNRDAMLVNTFYRPFRPIEGMADLYQSWVKGLNARFHYVSASPWQLYPSLQDFIGSSSFPSGTFHLRDFRWKDETFFKLFESPEAYKLAVIEPILERFPSRRFMLVGDSGEKDEEIYESLSRRYPQQVVHIMIRGGSFQPPPDAVWKEFGTGAKQ